MEKKTIIYIGGFELPDKNAAAHRVLSNAKALKLLGYNVIFIDVDKNGGKSIETTKKNCDGFISFSMRKDLRRFLSIKDLVKIYNKYFQNVCCIIAYNYPSIALNKLRAFCKKKCVKLFADCTEWYGFVGDNIVKRVLKGIDSFFRMNIIQSKLDGMIVISEYLKKYYQKKIPTICVPPLVDISEEKWITQKKQKEKKDIEIIYAGCPGKHKDKLNLIIKALAEIDNCNIKLTIIGISQEEFLKYYPPYEVFIKKLGDRLVFMGRIPHKEVIEHTKNADFCMFYREKTRVNMAGFPTKFSESISCGTPVLTNKTSDLSKYMIVGETGFWLKEDIALSIKTIFKNDKPDISKMKNEINKTVFDYHNFLDEFKIIF